MYLCGLKEVGIDKSERTSYLGEVKTPGKAIVNPSLRDGPSGVLATGVPHVRGSILSVIFCF